MKQNLRLLMLTLLCAVVSSAWGDTFKKVTQSSEIAAGNKYVLVCETKDVAMKIYASGTKCDAVDVTISNNIVSSVEGINILTLEAGDNGWYFKQEDGKYLYSTAAKNLKADANYKTLCTITDDYQINMGNDFGTIQYNSGSPRFCPYTSTQAKAYLYILDGVSETIAGPTFSPESGTVFDESQSVTISCGTEGAAIYYTTDGSTPSATSASSTLYETPFSITETTTVKAIAIKGNASSNVASATYTKMALLPIIQVRSKDDNEVVYTHGTVTSIVGTTAFIQDEDAAICVYGSGTSDLTKGDYIKVSGKLANFHGLLEITNPVCKVVSQGNYVTPAIMSIADIKGENSKQGWLVTIEEATVTKIEGQDATIAQGENTILVKDIPSNTGIAVNDIITLTGNISRYESVIQIANPMDIEITQENVEPIITVTPTLISADASGQEGTINVTCDNFKETPTLEYKFYEENGTTDANYEHGWVTISIISDKKVGYEVAANTGAARIAYLKVKANEGGETILSNLITISQKAYVSDIAELPFTFDGGKSDIESKNGLSQNGLGSDYGSSPKLKFDGTGDYLILHFNERPGNLSFDIKNNSFSGGKFTVQTSVDGETYTNLKEYTSITSTQNELFKNLNENVRYIKWIYTSKSSGNVGLGNIKLEKYVEPQSYTLTITPNDNAEIFAFDENDQTTAITSGSSVLEGTKILLSVDVTNGYTLTAISVKDGANNEVSLTENAEDETWSFTMPNSNVTVSCTVEEDEIPSGAIYSKVTSTGDLTTGTYLIVYETESVAFDGSLATLDAASNTVPVTIKTMEGNKQIIGTATIDAAVFDINVPKGTIKSASGFYIGVLGYDNGLKQNANPTTYTNAFSIDDNKDAVISIETTKGTMTLRYNSDSGQKRFRYFKSGQKAIQLYKLTTPEEIEVNFNAAAEGYSTLFYGTKNLIIPEGVKAYTYKVDDNGKAMEDEYETIIPAGSAVVVELEDKSLLTTDGYLATFTTTNASETAHTDNMLYGFDTKDQWTVGPDNKDYYFYSLSLNASSDPGSIGFYWNQDDGVKFKMPAHRAYLAVEKDLVNDVSAFTFEGMGTGINGIFANGLPADGVYTLTGVRVNSDRLQKGIYIVNGKKVVIK